MEYKILEANGIENENVDGAAFNNFTSRGIDGRMKGVLNECAVYKLDSSTIKVDTGELLIHGFRVKITSPYTIQRTASASPLSYQLVARITLSSDRSVLFNMECRLISSVQKDSLFSTESGVYEVEVARFTTDSSGISSITYVLPIIGQPEVLSDESIRAISNLILEKTTMHSVVIYIDDTNPAEKYGGYWLRIKDAFLWASGDTASITYTEMGVSVTKSLSVGSRGGEFAHSLTVEELASHNHSVDPFTSTFPFTTTPSDNNTVAIVLGGPVTGEHATIATVAHNTNNTGYGYPHNTMPPYYAVNAWVRVTEEEFNANESL